MTDRRERIIASLNSEEVVRLLDSTLYDLSHEYRIAHEGVGPDEFVPILAPSIADAVLAALADDLLPDLPDDVGQVWIHLMPKRSGNPYRKGTGPTLVAAIRTALNGGEQ